MYVPLFRRCCVDAPVAFRHVYGHPDTFLLFRPAHLTFRLPSDAPNTIPSFPRDLPLSRRLCTLLCSLTNTDHSTVLPPPRSIDLGAILIPHAPSRPPLGLVVASDTVPSGELPLPRRAFHRGIPISKHSSSDLAFPVVVPGLQAVQTPSGALHSLQDTGPSKALSLQYTLQDDLYARRTISRNGVREHTQY